MVGAADLRKSAGSEKRFPGEETIVGENHPELPAQGIYIIGDEKSSSSTLDMVSISSDSNVAECGGSGDFDNGKTTMDQKPPITKEEKWWSTLMQVSVPFFIAGIGTIGAGLVLDHVTCWPVFVNVNAILVLVPSLSGLKGNLDTCLASRLSTQANCGNMSSVKEIISMIVGNISLVQVQATVAAIIVSMFAICVSAILYQEFNPRYAILLTSSAVFTATSTCFILDFVLITVIIVSFKLKINPDNVATPFAGSIGDIVSLTVFSITASYLYRNIDERLWLPCVILVLYLLILPIWIYVVYHNKYTKSVLTTGWTPVISALFISGLGGLVLDQVQGNYDGFVVFQPIVNGIGGNLVSVLSSRISTLLHRTSLPGILPEGVKAFTWPWKILFNGTETAKTARMLIPLAACGQVIFMLAANFIAEGFHITINVAFGVSYVTCATMQVMVLLFICHIIVHQMWKHRIDPDNSAIPYLTALGDLLGSIFLGLAFFVLDITGQSINQYGDDANN